VQAEGLVKFAASVRQKKRSDDMHPIGVMLNNLERDRLAAFQVAVDEGFRVVHTNALQESWLTGPQRQQYIDAARASGLTIAAMFVGFDGQDYSSIDSVARTVGLIAIPDLWQHRTRIALAYSDLAHELNVPALGMHLGFMPKDKVYGLYTALVMAVKTIARQCAGRGQSLHLETGQESAAELLEFIQHVDLPNVGVNFDPANFLLYGTDEPLHALKILGTLVRGVHCKDGFRPEEPGKLGKEVPIGTGAVNFPAFLAELKRLNYTGPLVIERETGPNARAEIRQARQYLEGLLAG
jgi:sugar phosphate isomerase/epimerase